MVAFLTLSISTKYVYNLVFFGNFSSKGVVHRFVFVNAYIIIYGHDFDNESIIYLGNADSTQQKEQSIVVSYTLLCIL